MSCGIIAVEGRVEGLPPAHEGFMARKLRELSEQRRRGVVRELLGFMAESKKWWLTPIVAMLLLFGVLIFMSGTGAAPFIYTLF